MAEIKILVQGYAIKQPNGWKASATTTLIQDKNLSIIVDPGANEKLLARALAKEKLEPKDIDFIFLTHYHLDHVLNIRLFPRQTILDGDFMYRGDGETAYPGTIPGTTIKVIPTPGHSPEHHSLLVETKQGVVVVAGDLWWWEKNEQQKRDRRGLLNKKDPFAGDKNVLIKSRQKILALANYVIPGHGKMFEVGR